MDLVLASQSPYRRELLSRLKIPFRCENSFVDEDEFKKGHLNPTELATVLAKEKARTVLCKYPDAIVIGSDQVASVDGNVLDKPGNFHNAKKQLQTLQGKTHHLITAVCIISQQKCLEFQNTTALSMNHLKDEEIESYLKVDNPYDCAGSYKIESAGVALFNKIASSDFTSIIGLPLMELAKSLKQFEISLFSL